MDAINTEADDISIPSTVYSDEDWACNKKEIKRKNVEKWLEDVYQARGPPWAEGDALSYEGLNEEQLEVLREGGSGGCN